MPFYAVYNLQEFRKNALISSTEKQVGDTEWVFLGLYKYNLSPSRRSQNKWKFEKYTSVNRL
jgi:hypothetical protein